jgi:hypothetical protein
MPTGVTATITRPFRDLRIQTSDFKRLAGIHPCEAAKTAPTAYLAQRGNRLRPVTRHGAAGQWLADNEIHDPDPCAVSQHGTG